MDTRSFESCLFSLESYTCEVVFLKYIQTIHISLLKKKSVVTARLESTPSKTTLDLVLVLSPPLYQLSYHSAEGEGLISDI